MSAVRNRLRYARIATLAAMLGALAAGSSMAEEPKSDVLDPADGLPKNFTSIQSSEEPETKWRRIEALYRDPADGSTIRFTTVRGAKDMGEPGRHAIDVCVRDGKSGELLLAPQIFGAKPLIGECTREAKVSEAAPKRYPQILQALDSLAGVRFKAEYRPEYIALINQTTRAVPEGQEHTELGGGVLIHKKSPPLPGAGGSGADPPKQGASPPK
jgi:hypothetical protein